MNERTMSARGLLGKKGLVEEHLSRVGAHLSAFSFVSLFTWQDHFSFDIRPKDEQLLVFAHSDLGAFLYLPPLGPEISADTARFCFDEMFRINKGAGISRIDNVPLSQLEYFPTETYDHYLKGYEYGYFRQELVGFKGNALKSKRSSYNQFVQYYSFDYLSYEDRMREDCLRLYDRWADRRRTAVVDDVYRQMLTDNRRTHELALEFHKELGLTGRVVVVDGEVRAYTFGYPLTREIFCVFLEIAEVELKGLPVFIFREFCNDPQVQPYAFINAMDDFALPNIEQTKMSFRPAVLWPAYTVTRK